MALKFWIAPWNYLIRRDFLAFNNINFPEIKYGDDNFFVLFIVCLAKNIVRVPNTTYIYRNRADSLGHSQSVEINVRRYTDHFFQGVSIINTFSKKFKFLNDYPEFRFKLFEFLARNQFHSIAQFYGTNEILNIESLFIKSLENIDDKTPLTAFLCSRMNIFNINLIQQQQIIRQQQAQIRQLQAQLQSKQ